MEGILYGVGVGPGDPELLTLKAIRIIKECEVIAIPDSGKDNCIAYQIVEKAMAEIAQKEIISVDMPMTKDKAVLEESHRKGTELIAGYLEKGTSVAFLTIGDPTIYSTYIYVHNRIQKLGYKAQIINGIPSFCAVAATLNNSLVETSSELHIIPSSYGVEKALHLPGTKVLMKAGKKLGEVKRQLESMGLKAAMVSNCTMEQEKIYNTLADIPEEASYYSIIVVKDNENTN
jgi:precorrin-2/cobalt-factor-2 C20-methyltransferase